MTLEKAIEFGKIFLKSIENEKGSATYEFVETAVKTLEEQSVLDKIRAEIEDHCGLLKENHCKYCSYCNCVMGVREILEVIDKYKSESIETKQGLAYTDQETMMSAT